MKNPARRPGSDAVSEFAFLGVFLFLLIGRQTKQRSPASPDFAFSLAWTAVQAAVGEIGLQADLEEGEGSAKERQCSQTLSRRDRAASACMR